MTSHHSHTSTGQKTILAFLLLATISIGILGAPRKAHALFGLGNIAGLLGGGVGDPVIVTRDITRDLTILPKEMGLDSIAWTIAKMLVGDIIMDLQNFVNQGFFGDPLIVTDPDAFFAKLSRDATTAFMGEVSEADIYEPIKRQLLKQLAQSYTPYSERARSTIGDVLVNPEAFMEDFKQGGWTGFMALLEPQNNIYGQSYMAAEEHSTRVNTAVSNVKDELDQSGGLLSLPGKCLEYAGTYDIATKTQDSVSIDSFDYSGNAAAGTGATCIKWERVTPGQFIANTLSEALGSPLRSLENADEIEEMLATLINNLVSSLLTQGITAITGSSDGTTDSSSGSVSETISTDDRLIDILEEEITDATHLDTIENNVTVSSSRITETITDIDTLLSQGNFGILQDEILANRELLLSYRSELVTLGNRMSGYTTLIQAVNAPNNYVSSLETMLERAEQANTLKEVIAIYKSYNTTVEPIDVYTRTKVFDTETAITKDSNRVTEIAAAVDALMARLQGGTL
ncbi:MAG: hypothetical protein HGB03_03855 [Candidatus Yonathbacteria bacterium]|nr:hypothetical protein [Candidatus Yonathbacteria bacterium]NTW47634.1 hypothetical protein [Candidatus Yonathbacteria bacterium]